MMTITARRAGARIADRIASRLALHLQRAATPVPQMSAVTPANLHLPHKVGARQLGRYREFTLERDEFPHITDKAWRLIAELYKEMTSSAYGIDPNRARRELHIVAELLDDERARILLADG